MYTLYDPDFTAEYTDNDEVIIYHKGKEVAQTIAKDLKTDRQLIDIAISLLNKLYTRKEVHECNGSSRLAKCFPNVSPLDCRKSASAKLPLHHDRQEEVFYPERLRGFGTKIQRKER